MTTVNMHCARREPLAICPHGDYALICCGFDAEMHPKANALRAWLHGYIEAGSAFGMTYDD